jgi:putative endonuclease
LGKKGYSVLEINWRFEKTEVDIIARQNNTLVIIEVKTRTGDQFGFPEEAVGAAKQKNLALAAEEYLERNNLEMDVRFDVISITVTKEKPVIYHIEDAFFPYEI